MQCYLGISMKNRPLAQPLPEAEITHRLQSYQGWQLTNGALAKTYKLPSFAAAMELMVHMGQVCEQLDHHANWQSQYTTLAVQISTHEPKGISELDFEWIRLVEAFSPTVA